ncbi:hypothetical protein GOV05_01625 [Candidatus Woesearchaeota archaeon]|nr:hypothetical protein [Candidatus Woesearchaeota archaeon]
MAEKATLVEGDKIAYEGLFELKELMSLINSYIKQVGYDKKVVKNEQQVFDNFKQLSIELKPLKKITDYIKFEMKIKIEGREIEDVELRIDDRLRHMQKGRLSIVFFATMHTDYEGTWEQKPEYFFVRTLFNKFVYRAKMTQWESQLKEQVAHLKAEISSFLNIQRFHEKHTQQNTIK